MEIFNLFIKKRILLSFFYFFIVFQCIEVKAQFANGADVSWLTEMQDNGYVFNNSSGIQENCLQILKEKGINALRFRVWVNPANGYNGLKDVVRKAYIADSMGFKIMLDFHFSDTWADPAHQTKPAAWVGHSFSQLLTDIYNHTYKVLDTIKSLGVIPKWVQIGNEVNDGMLWEDGRASTHMSNFAAMIKSGYNAVKAVDSTIQVVIHLSNANDGGLYRWMFDGLKNNGAKWDVIGMSVYPYWVNMSWSVDDSLALLTMKDIISRYNTKVMVCEAGFLYNQPIEANHFLLDLIEKTKSVGGLGVFYWEPECYNWQNYNLGAWDPLTKEPTAVLDAFLGINATSVNEVKNASGFEFSIFPNPFNPSTTIQYSLPQTEKVVIEIYNVLGEHIKTLINKFEEAGKHSINWLGKDEYNNKVSSGIYFIRINNGKNFQTRKIIFLK